MQLIYHGQRFDYRPTASMASVAATQPRAVNWRYQVADQPTIRIQPIATSFRYRPNAVNWRYRAVMEA